MNKLFFILVILTTLSKFKAQIVLDRSELKKITIGNFSDSKYYKSLKSKAIVKAIVGSGKTIDGECIDISSTTYIFKKANVLFIFTPNNTDSVQSMILSDIYINSKNNLFITEDSIKVGDKVTLSSLCKNINKFEENYTKYNKKSRFHIFHNGVDYEFIISNPEKISSNTILTIKRINIRPYSLSPINY